jgi:hypothetical protein
MELIDFVIFRPKVCLRELMNFVKFFIIENSIKKIQ